MKKPKMHRREWGERKAILRHAVAWLCVALALSTASGALTASFDRSAANASGPDAPVAAGPVYLPLIMNQRTVRRINVPYFGADDVIAQHYAEMAIFWLGRITPTENYADVRIGHNSGELVLQIAIFDRRLWYDSSPSPADLTAWDSVTLYLNLAGNAGGAPATSAYRFDAQLSDWEDPRTAWQAAYRGDGAGWSALGAAFTTESAYRWEDDTQGGTNNDENNRGWVLTYRIPFASLGLPGAPAQGSVWGMALAIHDRDDGIGTPIADKTWPETADVNRSSTWGQLRFGLPGYSPPIGTPGGTVVVRHGLNGASVPDGAVGGTIDNLCPGDSYYTWNVWGNANFAGATGFNIQNQGDIADWPCFAKYYVTFPLDAVPSGKAILSATLTLHQWGNSGAICAAQRSFVQVMTLADGWSEATLAWNSAPLAEENVAWAWVDPVTGPLVWPGTPRAWDVSRAVAQAHAAGKPLRLALYSSDWAYHSGKFFTTSDTGDWNAEGRPTLRVTWGNP